MPCPERNGLPRRPHPAPLGARSRRPRQGRLEGNHLGRRARPHRRERQQNQGGLRPRIHRGHAGHGTRGRLVCVRLRVFRPGNPERPVHHERLFLLRPPHGRGGLHAWRRLSRIGLCGLLPRPLRRPPLRNPEVHRDLGQESAVFERRRLFRPCDHRPDEARLEADHRGSPRHLASRPFRIPPGAPARHGRRRRPRHAQRDHQRGPVRPRIRRNLVLRVRGAARTRPAVPARSRRAHLVGAQRDDRRCGARFRDEPPFDHCLGLGSRRGQERHAGRIRGHEPGSHHGQLRRAGRRDVGRPVQLHGPMAGRRLGVPRQRALGQARVRSRMGRVLLDVRQRPSRLAFALR